KSESQISPGNSNLRTARPRSSAGLDSTGYDRHAQCCRSKTGVTRVTRVTAPWAAVPSGNPVALREGDRGDNSLNVTPAHPGVNGGVTAETQGSRERHPGHPWHPDKAHQLMMST